MRTGEAIQLFLTSRRAMGLSARTLEQYTQQLRDFAKTIGILPCKPEDIEAFLAWLESKGVTPETVHSYFRTLRAFNNFMKKRHGMVSFLEGINPPRVPAKVMPTLDAVDIPLISIFIQNPRDMALFMLFIDTGIRETEAVNLQRRDIKEDYILVIGKVGQRAVPISETVKTMLLSLPVYEDGYVFHGRRGHLTRNGIYQIISKYLRKVGITKKCGPQRLRHTFGRHYLVLGGDTRSLQLILGHANIQTTERYANLVIDDVVKKHHEHTPIQLMEVR